MKKFLLSILIIFFVSIIFIFKNDSVAQKILEEEQNIQINFNKEISIKPHDKVIQGQTIFINIKTAKQLENPVFRFKDKEYKIFKIAENQYFGMLGINTMEKPAQYKLSMYDKTGNLNDNAFINVVIKKYPIQNITVTKKMSGLTATQHELNQIGKAKYLLTEKMYGSSYPYNSPAKGCIISEFGLRRYYNGKFSGDYHKGIDIKAPTGEPVKSMTDGKVIFAEKFRLHGGSVAVDHGHGVMSLYIHLSKIVIKPGEFVKADQKVGEVGQTGFATGPHLHWGLYVNGTPVDPMIDWIKPVNLCK
ncbi:MAG TPA: M23 family metallopeptidase [Candidatus Gastranaerophilales bacterium]|nr:M23 family metallopeptidase [Candidatus Gastranaerophilales bacterium]